MSENEIEEKLKILIPAKSSPVRKRVANGCLWKIAIIAAVVLCMSITVLAVPQLRTMLLNALQLDIGETVGDGGVTYVYDGVGTIYDNIDSLIASENLDILSFEDPTGVLTVTAIDHMEQISTTMVSFNDPTISLKISHSIQSISDTVKENAEEISTSYFVAYVSFKEAFGKQLYTASFYHGNDTYIITCSSKSTLLSVLNSLKKGE